ncbi:YcxB family protein [Arcicella sp. DC2W]|uniref:YcxB family protein n=1 Tax=Arcicella gelida TaxID=2984195 RepID=A0ABU5S211_9BACT|nr:YcxB family protein [Arcicella sp. DC2W]MEA5402502.1 YcxB family protein [Arcicella sp. DC2W]
MDKIVLITKLSIEDYIKINYHLFYRKLTVKVMTGVGVFMLISLLYAFHSFNEFPWFQLVFGLFLTIGQPISVYFSAKKNYKTNARIGERISYEFDNENVLVTGESFEAKFSWDKIYSVTENKDWILIWQNKQVANVVPKRDFKEGELQALKNIVSLHSKLIYKLSK